MQAARSSSTGGFFVFDRISNERYPYSTFQALVANDRPVARQDTLDTFG